MARKNRRYHGKGDFYNWRPWEENEILIKRIFYLNYIPIDNKDMVKFRKIPYLVILIERDKEEFYVTPLKEEINGELVNIKNICKIYKVSRTDFIKQIDDISKYNYLEIIKKLYNASLNNELIYPYENKEEVENELKSIVDTIPTLKKVYPKNKK